MTNRRAGNLVCAISTLVLLASAFSTSAAAWEPTFEESFEAGRLDEENWRLFDFWGNQTLAGNGERQCYVPEALRFEDGMLTIVAERDPRSRDDCSGAQTDLDYTSGMISTARCNEWDACEGEGFSQLYGFFAMRARLPSGRGMWPAFWLVPDDASWPPEIDVMEMLGHDPQTIYMTLHYFDADGERSKQGEAFTGPDTSQGFHEFAVDWQPGLLIWYVDGVERFRVTGEAVPDVPMYMIVNLAVGGYWPGVPDEETSFPAEMQVDWVRAWRRTADTPPDSLPTSPDS